MPAENDVSQLINGANLCLAIPRIEQLKAMILLTTQEHNCYSSAQQYRDHVNYSGCPLVYVTQQLSLPVCNVLALIFDEFVT